MTRARAIYLLSGIALLLLILAAFAIPSQAELVGAAGNPTISITYPPANANLPSRDVSVTVQVRNFQLVNKFGQANVKGQGHVHYFIDVPVPKDPTKPAEAAPGTFVPAANTSLTWTSVAPGMHQFSAELVNNDHTSLSPTAYDTVVINVGSTALNTTGALGIQRPTTSGAASIRR